MRVLAVPHEQAANILKRLSTQGLVDPSLRIAKRGHEVLIPVLREPSFSMTDFAARWETEARLAPRAPRRDPRRTLHERLQSSGIPADLAPRRWKRIGDVVVLRLRPAAQEYAKEIGRIYGSVLGAQTVLEDRSGIHGPLRTPDAREYLDVAFRALRGQGTIVYHELGPKEQFPDAMTRRLAAAARAHWMQVASIRTRIVKSYAPGIVHAAADVEVRPQARP